MCAERLACKGGEAWQCLVLERLAREGQEASWASADNRGPAR